MNRIFKKNLYLFALLSNLTLYSIDSIVTIFVQKYPYLSKSEISKIEQKPTDLDSAKYSKALKQPDFLYKGVIKSYKGKHQLPAIMCMYAGNIALSTPDGQLSFPRLQQVPDMYILVTDKIIPAYMIAPATVHNWMIDPKSPTEMYLMKLETDKKTGLSYWQTSKVDLPKDNNIPLNTLIFIADPSTMYIPLGATICDRSPNIVLPTIYIKRNFCFIKNSLFTLATNQYFRDTHPSVKQDDQTVMLIQQPDW
jgi:hypothetical protein